MRDLRETLAALRERGRLLEVSEPVSPRYEAAAVLAEAGRGGLGGVLLSHVTGHSVPVAGNVIYGREVLGWALNVPEAEVTATLAERLERPLPARSESTGPVLAETNTATPLEELLPVLTHYQADSAPFITTGLVSARDPDSGDLVRGIHRMELRGDRQAGITLLNPPLGTVYGKHKAAGRPMPVAVSVGMDPLTFAAFALKGAPGLDKLALAGGLQGVPVAITPGPVTGIEVPARSEFVLEGSLDPEDERPDGPLGEIGEYSLAFPASPTLTVERVCHRTDPIYHALLPTGPEGDLLLTATAEAAISGQVREMFPFVRRWHFVPTTFGSSLVVQMAPAPESLIRTLLVHLLTLGVVKKAVAVAEDVDPADPLEVEWSLATRFQPEPDAIVLRDLKGLPIDPSCGDGFRSSKLGIDATGYTRTQGQERAVIPTDARTKAKTLLTGRQP